MRRASLPCTTAGCRGVGATVCCPGPLATGLDGKPRVVYGASGLIMQANTGMSKKRVSAGRAAELIARAAYHGLGGLRLG